MPVLYEKLVPENKTHRDHLMEYRRKFGKGVRQRSNRQDTTKDRPGTLTPHLYSLEIQVELRHSLFFLPHTYSTEP